MADDPANGAAPIVMRNYQVIPIDAPATCALESWFAAADRGDDPLCAQCDRWCRGLYSWFCTACRADCAHRIIPGYRRAGDGALHPCPRCYDCGVGDLTVITKGAQVWAVCVRDTLTMYPGDPCARCGSMEGTQLHHWAPRAIFTDAERWPMSYLCRPCHRTWHQAMRAAGGVSLPTKASAA